MRYEKTKVTGIRNDMILASQAFTSNDPSQSKFVHEQKRKKSISHHHHNHHHISSTNDEEQQDDDHHHHSDVQHSHEEKHALVGEYVKSIVFGGLDGIITTFAIVAAGVASGLTFYALIIVGFANLVGDAFAMGLGDYFSSRAEVEQAQKLRRQYRWRCERELDKQKRILRRVFTKKGFELEDSIQIVELLSENKMVFADVMLLEIEGVQVEEQGWTEPIKEGIITFLSFMVFGAVPLASFIFAPGKTRKTGPDLYFWISIGLTAFSLVALGALKNFLVRKSVIRGGVIMLVQGGIATAMAYLVGWAFEKLVM